MQLKFHERKSVGQSIAQKLIKFLLLVIVFMVAAFLLEKINFPSPEQNFKKDITNEIIKLK